MFKRMQENMLEAKRAIIIYRNSSDSIITKHTIKNGTILEGSPLTRKEVVNLCKITMPRVKGELRIIPEEMIAYSELDKCMIWWREEKKEKIHFNPRTGIKSGECPLPAIVFVVKDKRLYVWAIKTNKRPTEETELYNPPFFNITASGVCMGNMKVPDKSDHKEWERLFFRSEFTTEGEQNLKGIQAKELWKNLTGRKYKKFPYFYLTRWGKLGELINKINRENDELH